VPATKQTTKLLKTQPEQEHSTLLDQSVLLNTSPSLLSDQSERLQLEKHSRPHLAPKATSIMTPKSDFALKTSEHVTLMVVTELVLDIPLEEHKLHQTFIELYELLYSKNTFL